MKPIIKRLIHLEEARRTYIETASPYGARALVEANLNRIAARIRAGGNWSPLPVATVEEIKREMKERFANYRTG